MSTKSSRTLLWTVVLATVLSVTLAACAPSLAPSTAPTAAPAPTAAAAATSAPAAAAASAATGAPSATEAPAQPALQGELVLNTWRDIGADPNHPNYSFHLLIQEWTKRNPGVKVVYQPMLGTVPEIFAYITTNLRSKTLQDGVVMLYPSPAQMDPELQYDFAPDLDKPNPYSTNKTWREDFPLDAVALKGVTTQGKTLMVSPTFIGDIGDGALLYNQDIMDKAGVTALPRTWAEFMDAMKKIKSAGFDPLFMPSAGNEVYIWSWQTGIFSDQLMPEVVKACDGQGGGTADGYISAIEGTWCAKTGKWNSETMRPVFQLMKDLSPYFHTGYLAPPPPGDPFMQGKVGFRWLSRLNVASVAANPDVKFKWGSFYQPPIKDGGTPVRYGNHTAGGGGQYYFIPLTTADKGKLPMALDLAQFVTSPESNKFWCSKQPVPCYEIGSTVENIFPDDPQKQTVWKGFVEPGTLKTGFSGLDINNTYSQAAAVQEVKIYQDFLTGTLTLDQALEAWQRLLDQLTENQIKQHPEWGADKW
ncbi:MAG: ABC transporter substrate-binding protein [Nitrososphaerales archaeon]